MERHLSPHYNGKNTQQPKGPWLGNDYTDKAICWDTMPV